MNRDDFDRDVGSEEAFERALLASAASDGVSDESVRGAWSRFAVTLGATATLAGAATHDALANGVTSSGRRVVQWISLGALGGGIVTAALMTVFGGRAVPATPGTRAAAPSSAATSVGVTASSGEAALVANRTPPEATPSAQEPAKRHPAHAVREAPARTPTARLDTSSSLAAEIALLDEARREQSAGQFERALAVLARYQREHPHGALRRESDLLKLETLSRRGDDDEAARLARQFLEAFPDDPHAARVRTFVR